MPFSVRLSNGAHFLFCVSILIFWIWRSKCYGI
nr:MAG TPA: hypothetical protein [Caudoviricetes sp.]